MRIYMYSKQNCNRAFDLDIPCYGTEGIRLDARFFKHLIHLIMEKGDEYFKYLLDTIGLKYHDLNVDKLMYLVDGNWLTLHSLSLGQQMFILSLVYRDVQCKVMLVGALDCLYPKTRYRYVRELYSCDNVIVLVLSHMVLLNKEYVLQCGNCVDLL